MTEKKGFKHYRNELRELESDLHNRIELMKASDLDTEDPEYFRKLQELKELVSVGEAWLSQIIVHVYKANYGEEPSDETPHSKTE